MQKRTERYHSKYKTRLIRKTRLRPWASLLFLMFFTSILFISCFIIFDWTKDNKNIEKIEEKIEEVVKPIENNEEGVLVNPPEDKESDYWYYINLPFYEVDFTELLKKNPDTVAFIHVPNTNINYPIVQANNNDYYLTHAFDKSKNSAGWVYIDYRNSNSFTDDNTIVYGHGRLNKTVFGSLKDTLTKDWQNNKENYVIQISTPTANFVYQIFSIYTIDAESYYIIPGFNTVSAKEEWLATMKNRNTAPMNVSLNASDKIITLSTCQNNDGGRIVVQGKLIKQQEK